MKDKYDNLSPKDKEREHMLNCILMERIKRGENPFEGNIIKAGEYDYNPKSAEEEKINAILQKISPNIQDEVERLVEEQRRMEEAEKALQDKLLEEVLKMASPQNDVDNRAQSAKKQEKEDEGR